ncbi:MAG: DoxX family protein [Chloroflexota bacterium]
MDTAITVIQVLLVVGFTIGGLAQLTVPYARYTQLPAQGWANDFKPWHVKLIGFLKVCATVGMIASLFLPSLKMLTPPAAVGIALVMAGAMATHLRREEYVNVVGNLVFLGFALFVAYGRLVGFAA